MGILEQINEIIDKEIKGKNGIEVYGLNVARTWGKTTFNISCRKGYVTFGTKEDMVAWFERSGFKIYAENKS